MSENNHYVILRQNKDDVITEANKWLKANVGNNGIKWDCLVAGSWDRYTSHAFIFEEENDALLFKLTFGGLDG